MRSHPARPTDTTLLELAASAPTLRHADESEMPPYFVDRTGKGWELETIEKQPQRATWTGDMPARFSDNASPSFKAFVSSFRKRNG